ncbi:M23 family metallopeptidase [Robertkochia marina]|uniref:M23 family metallopeptidase n=1 Tax=Robertkochia marina TaxID=1227945 RepID=A0A4S3LZF6_9FLAO|nr:M23 family metallopeptidase [Robertkochia marina]THD66531.1 M23 family metallopeptidase [Robertkochia marina]TRZ45628.1 M23 family peptidase [Robertkochia marina]
MRTLILVSLLVVQTVFSQNPYPSDVFGDPLDVPIILAGSFGELRSNHFHAGLDIKTQQQEGLKVYAIESGYISRIKVQHYGYGKALYLTHPNGYTSVYAHLQKMAPEIEAFLKEKQYKNETYEIDLYLEPSELKIEKGQVIAYSGNTGSSGGPHLHFEIRDLAQKPINPLYFGYDVQDTEPPRILDLYVYPYSDNAIVNGANHKIPLRIDKNEDGSFIAEKVYAQGALGFGINTYDRQDLAYNKNGAYKVAMQVNGSPYFSYEFETFSFGESRYINTLIDYNHYEAEGERIQKIFLEPYNKLSIYRDNENNGIIEVIENNTYNVILQVTDFHGNRSEITIPVEGRKQELKRQKETVKTPYYVIAGRDNLYQLEGASIFFDKGTFYHDFYADLGIEEETVKVAHPGIPVKSAYTLTLEGNGIPEEQKDQYFIAHIDDRGRTFYENTYRKGNTYSTRTSSLGNFKLVRDSVAPDVRAGNFREGQVLSNFRYLRLYIKDDLSGIDTYEAKIDGQWVLMEYEYKKGSLTFNFEDLEFEGGKHELEVKVTDNVGNSTTFNTSFYRN